MWLLASIVGWSGGERLNAYLVVRGLTLADLVLVSGPEARAVGCEHFVDEHDLARLVEAELELGVGNDDAAFLGILASLLIWSQFCED